MRKVTVIVEFEDGTTATGEATSDDGWDCWELDGRHNEDTDDLMASITGHLTTN